MPEPVTLSQLNDGNFTVQVSDNTILEPINAPPQFRQALYRFGDHYDLSVDSHLYRFLLALCGEAGAGALKKEMLFPKLQQMLDSTYFRDLDRLYGTPLGLPRLSPEIYEVDPYNQALTQEQWRDVRIKDALYRNRCLTWMRAIIAGPTTKGIKLAAEAALGEECDVIEQYKYLDNQASDEPLTLFNYGKTSSRQEFIIKPLVPDLDQSERRRIMTLVDRLRPTNTIPTITDESDSLRMTRAVLAVDATSEAFYVTRTVTGRQDVLWPPVDPSAGFWIIPGEGAEAPTTPFADKQETVTFISIQTVTASSEHTGTFNKSQRQLFSHLSKNVDPFETFVAEDATASATVPLQVSNPWVNR